MPPRLNEHVVVPPFVHNQNRTAPSLTSLTHLACEKARTCAIKGVDQICARPTVAARVTSALINLDVAGDSSEATSAVACIRGITGAIDTSAGANSCSIERVSDNQMVSVTCNVLGNKTREAGESIRLVKRASEPQRLHAPVSQLSPVHPVGQRQK